MNTKILNPNDFSFLETGASYEFSTNWNRGDFKLFFNCLVGFIYIRLGLKYRL